jgi:hypothetical protein
LHFLRGGGCKSYSMDSLLLSIRISIIVSDRPLKRIRFYFDESADLIVETGEKN